MNLSRKEEIILRMLIGRGELYGLQMVSASEGTLKRGTIYVTLGRMEDKGLVESWIEKLEEETCRPRRRIYRVTGLGASVIHSWNNFTTRLAYQTR